MSKIHLEIEIPGNAKTYEFVLDDRLELEGLIQDNETFREVGIKNGSRVVMV